MKTNHDGTVTLNAYDTWTAWTACAACAACGQRVTGDSIHTCSPQTKPLSDDEIEQLREYHGINDWLYETSVTDFARAIEERHGIK